MSWFGLWQVQLSLPQAKPAQGALRLHIQLDSLFWRSRSPAQIQHPRRPLHTLGCLAALLQHPSFCGLPLMKHHDVCPGVPCRLPMATQRLPPSTARLPTHSCPFTSPHLPSVLARPLGQMGRPGSLEVRLSGLHASGVVQLKHHHKTISIKRAPTGLDACANSLQMPASYTYRLRPGLQPKDWASAQQTASLRKSSLHGAATLHALAGPTAVSGSVEAAAMLMMVRTRLCVHRLLARGAVGIVTAGIDANLRSQLTVACPPCCAGDAVGATPGYIGNGFFDVRRVQGTNVATVANMPVAR